MADSHKDERPQNDGLTEFHSGIDGIPKAAKSDCKAHTSDKRLAGRNALAVS